MSVVANSLEALRVSTPETYVEAMRRREYEALSSICCEFNDPVTPSSRLTAMQARLLEEDEYSEKLSNH